MNNKEIINNIIQSSDIIHRKNLRKERIFVTSISKTKEMEQDGYILDGKLTNKYFEDHIDYEALGKLAEFV